LGLSLLSSGAASAAFVLIVLAAFAGRLTLGDITLYVSAVAAVQGALNGLFSATAGLHESVLFHSYFQALQALPPVLPVKTNPQPIAPLAAGLELRQVSFRYHPEQPWVLRDVNLKIPAGSCLALVGLNGAGKTTLVKLLTRLYDPTEGQILWDGIDIREFDPAEFRQRIGAIFQDFMRYDLTVRENIGLGNLAQINKLEQIQRVAQQANIHDELLRLPHGYETELSRVFAEEGQGLDLSGGQWQKVATARLFVRQADLLILDEPTAALDAQAEYDLYRHFSELMAGRTSFLISHRFSTVRMADLIAMLEDGRISEYGTHDQLLQRNGTYARLYNMQAESYLQ
jgi:ATP-binding cassette subfamily B protein